MNLERSVEEEIYLQYLGSFLPAWKQLRGSWESPASGHKFSDIEGVNCHVYVRMNVDDKVEE